MSLTIEPEFTEVESGQKANRPELTKAITACQLKGAKLVVAKLDRLGRDLHFISSLQKSKFVVAEMPETLLLLVYSEKENGKNRVPRSGAEDPPVGLWKSGRDFSGKKLRELTVHHKDNNYRNNPPDGSNWELLCIYCHDNDHSRSLEPNGYPLKI